MRYSRKHRLIEIEWPEFGECGPPPRPPVGEFEAGIDAARSALERLSLTHLVVYGDHEYFANLAYLTGFLDEWLSSPIYPGSTVLLHSGMVMQMDVTPFSPVYFSTRMEDGVVIADESLRHQLQEQFPECFSRRQKRREFMRKTLGISVPEEVLPLSNIPSLVPPFFLKPNTVLALEQ